MMPLVCRAPDGRRYLVPSVRRYPARALDPQPEPAAEQTTSSVDRSVKVTAEDARAIRADYVAGKSSQGDDAHIYGITQDTVSRIVNSQAHIYPTPQEQDS